MPSITTWNRIEPRARSGDLAPALEARVHDPLWSLARQWQFGEFAGDDAGSPIWVRLRATADRLSRFRPGPQDAPAARAAVDYDPGSPLEVVVEAEPAARDLRSSAEGGQHLLRMLAASGHADAGAAFREAFPFSPDLSTGPRLDDAARGFVAVMAGRVPDGEAVARALRAARPGRLPSALGLDATASAAVAPVAGRWLTWYDAQLAGPPSGRNGTPSSWDPARMEHTFAVAAASAAGEVVLTADAYAGGRLEWHAFVHDADVSPLGATEDREQIVRTVLPAPVSFPGMPARRYWEFEDARVNLGGIAAAPEDLARMLVAEFATVYSNDFYVVPLEVPVGSLTRLTSVVVCDTFGERSLLPLPGEGTGDDDFTLFRLAHGRGAGAGASDAGLLLAPVLADVLQSEPVEEVALVRDEGANQAWAIERSVQDLVGRPLDRAAASRTPPPAAAPPAPATLTYRLRTDVPEHWVPLLPHEDRPGAVRLRRAVLTRPGPGGGAVPLDPWGRLLVPGETLDLFEEEVPREGVVLTRAFQYARWAGGGSFCWIGRSKRPGRGEVSSGLRFDVLE